MSYLLKLYETYEANRDQVGVIRKAQNGQEYTLLPISHTTQTAHIEVLVTEEGEFHSASILGKKGEITLIPCTEDSASRSGTKIAPYPLHDKLSYVAGDLVKFSRKQKSDEPFRCYLEQLEHWATSKYATDKLKSIYRYIRKRTLIADLVNDGILHVDDQNKLIEKWDKERGEKPLIFQVLSGNQESAFVRFSVHSPQKNLEKVWQDEAMYESFIRFYNDWLHEEDYCYVTGKYLPQTHKHANKIRHAGDKSKLISSNDKSGFTYRGRFTKAAQAASISYEASQKAHNALKWLIHKQGKVIHNRVFLVWGNRLVSVPDPMEDTPVALQLGFETSTKKKAYTFENYAKRVAKAIDGVKSELSLDEDVNILVLDSATEGRLAVLYYRSLKGDDYLQRLQDWHTTCVWNHRWKDVAFYGTPSTLNIAYAAYGSGANEKVIKSLMERMLPCIIDGQSIPQDIVRRLFQRAINPMAFADAWEWEKTLSIACAVINKQQGGIGVALDQTIEDRSYLFGRLLAIADVLERSALRDGEKRDTNAVRYMTAFQRHPERTWQTIQFALLPYQGRLGAKATYFSKLIDEVASKIPYEDFNNKPLTGKFLLGFYSQRYELYQKKNSDLSETDTTKEEA